MTLPLQTSDTLAEDLMNSIATMTDGQVTDLADALVLAETFYERMARRMDSEHQSATRLLHIRRHNALTVLLDGAGVAR